MIKFLVILLLWYFLKYSIQENNYMNNNELQKFQICNKNDNCIPLPSMYF